jgi:hypothetical protein
MNEHEVGKVLISTLSNIVHDRIYCHRSTIKGYSHLTENGERLMSELIQTMVPVLIAAQEKQLEDQAKEFMLEQMKK